MKVPVNQKKEVAIWQYTAASYKAILQYTFFYLDHIDRNIYRGQSTKILYYHYYKLLVLCCYTFMHFSFSWHFPTEIQNTGFQGSVILAKFYVDIILWFVRPLTMWEAIAYLLNQIQRSSICLSMCFILYMKRSMIFGL